MNTARAEGGPVSFFLEVEGHGKFVPHGICDADPIITATDIGDPLAS